MLGHLASYFIYLYFYINMEQTTLWAVAESQQTLTNAQPTVEQPAVVTDNWTWTSSSVEENSTATQPVAEAPVAEQPAQPDVSPEDLLSQVNNIINEGKTLETVAQETEQTQLEKENADALKSIVEENTKDLTSTPEEVKTDVVDNADDNSQLDEELKQGLEDIKSKEQATEMAKKVYLAFQKERSIHQFDNEQNKNTIEVLKGMVKKLNEQVATADNDPRITKLDDEMYTLNKLEQAYKKDKSEVSKKNLTRYYVAKLATLNPVMNANKIMDIFSGNAMTSNTMGATIPNSTPVVEPKKEAPKPMWIPASRRGMF